MPAAEALTMMDRGPVLDDNVEAETLRRTVLRRLTDLVALPSGRLTRNERALVADILIYAMSGCPAPLRREVAARMSRTPDAPQSLLRAAMLDEYDVAEPLLLDQSVDLPENLLAETARRGSSKHAAAVARRQDLTTSVVDALVERREEAILVAVLSSRTPISAAAMDHLVSVAAFDPRVLRLLVERPELEPVQGFQLFWSCDRESRRRVLLRFALDRRVAQDALDDLFGPVFRGRHQDEFLRDLFRLIERRHRPRGGDGKPVSMQVVQKTLHRVQINATPDLLKATALIAGVDPDVAHRIVLDKGGEPFAIMCKAIGVERRDFVDLCRFLEPAEAEARARVFDETARDLSRAIIRVWNWKARIARRDARTADDLLDDALTF